MKRTTLPPGREKELPHDARPVVGYNGRVSRAPLATRVFALLGVVLVVAALFLALLGSFAYVHIASVGMFLVAAALIWGVIRQPFPRAAALSSLAGIALVMVGLVMMPFTYAGFIYAGWGLIAASVVIALVAARAISSRPSRT